MNITTAKCPEYALIYNLNTVNLTSQIKSTWISYQVINGFAAPVTFFINFLVIWVILEKESLRTNKSNILLTALAFTDLLVSAIPQPMSVWMFNCFLRDGCIVTCGFLDYVSAIPFSILMLSISTLMLVSVDRYIAVKHPFLYQDISLKKVAISVIFTWTFVLIFAAITHAIRSPLLFVPAILVTIYCTLYVQISAYRQMKAIIGQAMAILGQATEEQKQEHKRRYQETKKTVTMCMLVFSSFAMYLPGIGQSVALATGFNINTAIIIPITSTFVFLQSLVNPLIMSLRLSYIRTPILRKLGKLFGINIANEQ